MILLRHRFEWSAEECAYGDENPFDRLIQLKQETEISKKATPGAKCIKCGGTLTYAPFCRCGKDRVAYTSPGKDAYHNSRLGEIHYKGKTVGGAQEFFSARLEETKIVGWLVGSTRARMEDITNQPPYRIARVVVHPTYRGCGVGKRLIQSYVKYRPNCYTIAAMARFNPVFEKAGMRRIADVEMTPPKEFKKFPLTPFQWASKDACQKLLETESSCLQVLLDNVEMFKSDIHPGGKFFKTSDEMREYIKTNLSVAARILWKIRPKTMAKFVGPSWRA
jgi:GNAT superfamily N-acetyltransferase